MILVIFNSKTGILPVILIKLNLGAFTGQQSDANWTCTCYNSGMKGTPHNSTNLKNAKIYDAYISWYSLPVVLRALPATRLAELGFDMTDPTFAKLVGIRFKKDFAESFNISRDTLNDWEKRKDFTTRLNELSTDRNVLRFEKDVGFHFTQKTIKEGDAARVKLWYQLFTGWSEHQKVEQTSTVKFIFERKKGYQ